MDLKPTIDASSPILLQVTKIDNDLSKNRYVTYCEIPTQPNNYRPLEQITQITLIGKILKFKILDLQSADSFPLYYNAVVSQKPNKVIQIILKIQHGQIKMQGKILNQSDNTGTVFALSITQINGYSSFINYRKKYKTLQNITRKQQFQLDHRLKVTVKNSNSSFYFAMEQNDLSKYFFSQKKLIFQLEEIFRIQDWQTIQSIHEEELDLQSLQTCANTQITILNKLKLNLNIQLIKNSNFTQCQIASLRILEATPQTESIIAGTDKQQQMISVNRLMDKYFDYQYAYLNKNLKQLQGTSVYEHINKLTPSFPAYPHFINSKIIHVNSSKLLIFKIGKTTLKLPFVYTLKGLNILETQQLSIKFFIQFKDPSQTSLKQLITADDRKFFQLSIKDIWNLGLVAKSSTQFQIKIMTDNTIFCIPFTRSQIQKANFRRQAKQLEMKQQYGQFSQNKYFMLTKSDKKDKIFITKTQNINQFYLLDLGTSSSVYFQIFSSGKITHQGIMPRQNFIETKHQLEVIMSSPDNSQKIVLFMNTREIKQQNQSLRLYYKVMQRLQFTDQTPCDNVRYTLQLKRLSDNKKIKSQLHPQMQSDGISSLITMEDGFYHPSSPQLQLQISVRKMFYDQQTQVFDNDQILSKKLIINSSAQKLLQKQCLFLNIQAQGYSGIGFDFYDSNIKKRLKLYLQFLVRKNSFFDATSGSYKIKIPAFLWKLNSYIGPSPDIKIKSHLSHKKKKGAQVSLYPDSPQQYSLPFLNSKDGISIRLNDQVGYQKVMDAIKLRCDIVKNTLGWLQESQWYLAIINVGKYAFHFMIKFSYDGIDQDSDENSVKSGRTIGKNGSQRSYGEKIDPLAKTVRNMDLFNIKKMKNNVILQGRKLTTQYIKCQQTITNLTKKINEIEQLSSKITRQQKQSSKNLSNTSRTHQPTKESSKLSTFYRSICQCGAKNPKHNGFCDQCLIKMKKRYEAYFKEYKQKSYIYEKLCFDRFNNKQKLVRIKNKIKSYKEQLKYGSSFEENDIGQVVKNLQEQQLKRAIQSSNIEIFRLKEQEKNIQIYGKSRQEALEKRIKKEDDEIIQSVQQIDLLNNQIQDLKEKLATLQ